MKVTAVIMAAEANVSGPRAVAIIPSSFSL